MALTLHSSLSDAFSADAAPIFLLQITDGVTTWSAQSGKHDSMTYPEAVIEVGAISSKIDPLRRTMSHDQVRVIVEDGWLRPILVNNQLHGKKAIVKIGAVGVTEANFADYYSLGIIEKLVPREGSVIEISIMNALGVLRLRQIRSAPWTYDHPLEVAKDILAEAGISAALYNTTSFDPSQTEYASIGHYRIGRGLGTIDGEPHYGAHGTTNFGASLALGADAGEHQDGFSLISEIGELLNGSMLVLEDGKIRFKLFDASASAVRTLTTDDYSEFTQRDSTGIVVNEAVGSAARVGHDVPNTDVKAGQYRSHFFRSDSTSQTNFAYPGESARVFSHWLKTPWLDGTTGLLWGVAAPGGGDDTGVAYRVAGWSGTAISGSTPAWSRIGASTPMWIYVPATGEVLKCTAAPTQSGQDLPFQSDEDGPVFDFGSVYYPHSYSSIAFSGRSQLGTTGAVIPYIREANDITILYDWANSILARFKDGANEVTFRTSLRHYDLQIGDFVELSSTSFLAYQYDGTSAGNKYEITSKEVDLFSESPSIRWSAVEVKSGTPSTVYDFIQNLQIPLDQARAAPWWINSGLTLSHVADLNFQVSTGEAQSSDAFARVNEVATFTFEATKDNYVIGSRSGLRYISTTIGADPPVLAPGEFFVGYAKTNGTTIDGAVSNVYRDVGPDGPDVQLHQAYALNANPHFEHWNKSFSSVPTGWSATSGAWETDFRVNRSVTDSGKYSVEFISRTAGSLGAAAELYSEYIPIEEGPTGSGNRRYTFTTACRATSVAGGDTVGFKVTWYNGAKVAGKTTAIHSAILPNTTDWHLLSGVDEADSGARYVRVHISKADTEFAAYFDRVTHKPESRYCQGASAATQTIGAGAWTKVTFGTVGEFGIDVASSIATVKTAGLYLMVATVQFDDPGDGRQTGAKFVKNSAGAPADLCIGQYEMGSADSDMIINLSWIEMLAAGDTIEVQGYSSGGCDILATNTKFRIAELESK